LNKLFLFLNFAVFSKVPIKVIVSQNRIYLAQAVGFIIEKKKSNFKENFKEDFYRKYQKDYGLVEYRSFFLEYIEYKLEHTNRSTSRNIFAAT